MSEAFEQIGTAIKEFFANAGLKILSLIAVVIFGIALIKIIKLILKKILLRSPIDNSLISFTLSIVNFLMYFLLIMIVAHMMGIPTTSFIALLSPFGLAASLALQDSLGNLANGIIIISSKPFKVGDFVDVDGISGTIRSIRMLHTKIETTDNKVISVPNSKIISSAIINYNANPLRRLDIDVAVAYGSDIESVKSTLMDIVIEHPYSLSTPEPLVRLKTLGESALVFTVRIWCKSENYWDLYYDVNETCYNVLNEKGITIPYNQLDVHIKDVGGYVLGRLEKTSEDAAPETNFRDNSEPNGDIRSGEEDKQ